MKNTAIILFAAILVLTGCGQKTNRKVISLNGTWEITESFNTENIPEEFVATVPVPGLADMASKEFEDIGHPSDFRKAFWYKRKFSVDYSEEDVVLLKIRKAKYGKEVFVNGNSVGSDNYSFTPSHFYIQKYLKPGENEIVIRIGSDRDALPDNAPDGSDFEKTKYIPGIYDDVELIVMKPPFISNIQTVPDINNDAVRIVTEVNLPEKHDNVALHYEVREKKTGNIVAEARSHGKKIKGHDTIDFTVKLQEPELWSPEHPFLYEVSVSTGTDEETVTFGMREFRFNPETKRAELNGNTYFMRGTNVCIFRFFEDPDRDSLPWDRDWVRELHRKFKSMNWNCIRYCIGFPPDFWYDIADEEGILIQDEYPIWTGLAWNGPTHFSELYPDMTPGHLAKHYENWMRERWNHPCVVLWDAQNESVTEVTGPAIDQVRHLDLSDRPWDNGYAPPRRPSDPVETHPYRFIRYLKGAEVSESGALKDLFSAPERPDNGPNERMPKEDSALYQNPIIINEYAWIWLNRNGTPTTLTDKVYAKAFPNDTTPEQRYQAYAKTMGIVTEYWRCHRQCAAVLHFCGLGYSRPEPPRGQTSDNFTDIQELTFEPNFKNYVKQSFSPVALMIDVWDNHFKPGQNIFIPVFVINDLKKGWAGKVTYILVNENNERIQEESKELELGGFERKIIEFNKSLPEEAGNYQIIAEIEYRGETIKSRRDFSIKKE